MRAKFNGVMALVLVGGLAVASWAQGPPTTPFNADGEGVMLHGYDPVAYFTEGKAVAGRRDIDLVWSGVRWRFASVANREAFATTPDRYAPQFGGYCAWAVSRNYVADVDPKAFAIVDGKLYVNYSSLVAARWRLDRDTNIARGHQNWPGLRAQATAAVTPAAAGKKGGR